MTEVRKYLIPDSNDEIRQEQMRELEMISVNGESVLDTLKQQSQAALLLGISVRDFYIKQYLSKVES